MARVLCTIFCRQTKQIATGNEGTKPCRSRFHRSTGTRPGRRKRGLPVRRRLPGRAEHGRTRLQPHEDHGKAATRYDRLDETFLANLQLILIAVYLKKHSQNPTSVNTP